MASAETTGHSRPAVDDEEPPAKQLKLSVENHQVHPSYTGEIGSIPNGRQSGSEDPNGALFPDHGEANLASVLPEDGSNLGLEVDDAQVGSLETGPSSSEQTRIGEEFAKEGTKTEELSNSGTGVAQVTELGASPMVIDGENEGFSQGVGIAQIEEEERVQPHENEEGGKVASSSSVLEGNTLNGVHVSDANEGAPTGKIVGHSLPLDLGAGTSGVQRTKTSLCSYFRKKGCRHGAACRYAHGEEELKPRPDGSWDPTSERAKAALSQMSADVTNIVVDLPPAPVETTVSEGPKDSGVNPLSKCIIHVPRGWSVDHFKKFLTENGIVYTTAKKRKGMSVAFVGFKTPEDVTKATEILDGKSVNAKQLKVAESRSRSWEKDGALNLIDRAKGATHDDGGEGINDPGLPGQGSDDEDVGDLELAAISRAGPAGEIRNVCDAVTPLADKTYEEQLSIKRDIIVQVLKRLVRNTRKGISSGGLLPDWISSAKETGGLPCAMEGVLASPLIDGYRNKCEFSIGCAADGERVVGFQVGSFREGMLTVAEPTDCRNVSKTARTYAALFQKFVRQSELPVWDKKNNSGFWRLLTVREGRASGVGDMSEVMLVVQVCPNGIEEERRTTEYAKMTDFIVTSANSASPTLPLTALLVQDHGGISNVASADAPLHPLAIRKSDINTDVVAKGYIHDHINNLQFRISPTAFFQVNTLAAERLYSLAGDWAGLTEDTLLFDVCCGTGTIGLTLAHRVGLVVGIEMNASAVADAQKNAEINNITNCRFVCSKAEDIMDSLLKEYLADEEPHAPDDDQGGATEVTELMEVTEVTNADDDLELGEFKQNSAEILVGDHESHVDNETGLLSRKQMEAQDDVVEVEKIRCPGSNDGRESTRTGTGSNGEQEGTAPRRKYKNIVAIVDPPRVGLHPVVLKTLRLHTELRRLVYISCNPQSLLANAVELCTPLQTADPNAEKGKGGWRGRTNWKGMSNVGQARHRVKKMPPSEPFRPVKAIAVDLFPHTIHCEMVMLLER